MKQLAIALGFALTTAFAAAAAADAPVAAPLFISSGLATPSAQASGLVVASGCIPRGLPGCYYAPRNSQYWCPLTPDEIAGLTCTGPYANG